MPLYPEDWNLSYVRDAYGALYGAHSVQIALRDTMKLWLPTYIAEFNRQIGTEVLAVPVEYERLPQDTTAPRGVRAAIVPSVTGTAGDPERRGDGSYDVWWKADVLAWVHGTGDFWETQAITHAYTTAVRAAVMQHPSLGNFAQGVEWVGEDFKYGQLSSMRYIGEGTVSFEVSVVGTMNALQGPPLAAFAADPNDSAPSLGPIGQQPDVASADVVITKEAL